MICPHAKKQRQGCEKPYLVCLHPKTRIVKCYEEAMCPLINMTDAEETDSELSSTERHNETGAVQSELNF